MRNFFQSVLTVFAIASLPALGATDFSGTWVLDPARSNLGAGAGAGAAAAKSPMSTMTLVIRQTSATLATDRKAGDRVETAIHKLDGSPSVNKTPSGADVTSTSAWVGNTLVTKSSATIQGTAVQSSDVRSLEDGGKTMVIEVTRQTPRGDVKQRLVYNRQ